MMVQIFSKKVYLGVAHSSTDAGILLYNALLVVHVAFGVEIATDKFPVVDAESLIGRLTAIAFDADHIRIISKTTMPH